MSIDIQVNRKKFVLMDNFLLTIVGPTAVGKTGLAIELAQYYKTEIISADSRQLYHEMELGTAKPDKNELAAVPHHFINSHSIFDEVSAGRFEKMALTTIGKLFKTKKLLIMVGGSGLYIDAVTSGFAEIPEVDAGIRSKLNEQLEEEGLEKLTDYLKRVDPAYFAMVDLNNPQRVVRALEVYEGTGIAYSHWRKPVAGKRDFQTIRIGLELDKAKLYERIDRRMDSMIEAGLFGEAEKLFEYRHLNALQTVGYREIFGYLEGLYEREECIRLLKRNSRRYAKRQMTWFKKDGSIRWFAPDDCEGVINYVMTVTS